MKSISSTTAPATAASTTVSTNECVTVTTGTAVAGNRPTLHLSRRYAITTNTNNHHHDNTNKRTIHQYQPPPQQQQQQQPEYQFHTKSSSSSSIRQKVPIPSSFVDDLLCRLKKKKTKDSHDSDTDTSDSSSNDDDDDDTITVVSEGVSNNDDTHVPSHYPNDDDCTDGATTSDDNTIISITTTRTRKTGNVVPKKKKTITIPTCEGIVDEATDMNPLPIPPPHPTRQQQQQQQRATKTASSSTTSSTRTKALLREQLHQYKVALTTTTTKTLAAPVVVRPAAPPEPNSSDSVSNGITPRRTTTTTATTSEKHKHKHNYHHDPNTVNRTKCGTTTTTTTTTVVPSDSYIPPPPQELTSVNVVSIVDEVFSNCLQSCSTGTTNDSIDHHNSNNNIFATTKNGSTHQSSSSSSFLSTCTIQEFYALVQNHMNNTVTNGTTSESCRNNSTTMNPTKKRTRRTIVLKKEMKLMIKERLHFLIEQQRQHRQHHQKETNSSLSTTATNKTTRATTTDTATTNGSSPKKRRLQRIESQPQEQQEIALATKVTKRTVADATHATACVPTLQQQRQQVEEYDGNTKENYPIADDDNHINPSISLDDGKINVDTSSTTKPLETGIPPKVKGRRTRIPQPKKIKVTTTTNTNKELSMADECMIIVESIKKKNNATRSTIIPPSHPPPTFHPPTLEDVPTDLHTTAHCETILRKRKAASCPLCTKCPCQLKSHISDAAGNNKRGKAMMDLNAFSQSDTAIEKILLQKLHTYEMMTDQYDEQTESIRRLVKKHRRSMYQKRQAMLQQYDAHHHHRLQGGATTGSSRLVSRFLPNLDELESNASTETIRTDPKSRAELERAKTSLFGCKVRTKPMTTNNIIQPTLTQMIGPKITTSRAMEEDAALEDIVEDVDEGVRDDDTNDLPHHETWNDKEDERSDQQDLTMLDIAVVHSTPPPKAFRVDSSIPKPDGGSSANHQEVSSPPPNLHWCNDNNNKTISGTGSSIWDSFRFGIYDSSWDIWFVASTTEATRIDQTIAVNHLLQLLPTTPDASVRKSSSTIPSTPLSNMSSRAVTLVDNVMNEVRSNPLQLSAVEQINPNWKENIRYAMGQTDAGMVQDALQNVRLVQDKLRHMKEQIVANIDQQQQVLDVYEETLRLSQSRFDSITTPPPVALLTIGHNVRTAASGIVALPSSSSSVSPPPPRPPSPLPSIEMTQGFFLSQYAPTYDDDQAKTPPINNPFALDDVMQQRIDRNDMENDIAEIFYSNNDSDDER